MFKLFSEKLNGIGDTSLSVGGTGSPRGVSGAARSWRSPRNSAKRSSCKPQALYSQLSHLECFLPMLKFMFFDICVTIFQCMCKIVPYMHWKMGS